MVSQVPKGAEVQCTRKAQDWDAPWCQTKTPPGRESYFEIQTVNKIQSNLLGSNGLYPITLRMETSQVAQVDIYMSMPRSRILWNKKLGPIVYSTHPAELVYREISRGLLHSFTWTYSSRNAINFSKKRAFKSFNPAQSSADTHRLISMTLSSRDLVDSIFAVSQLRWQLFNKKLKRIY